MREFSATNQLFRCDFNRFQFQAFASDFPDFPSEKIFHGFFLPSIILKVDSFPENSGDCSQRSDKVKEETRVQVPTIF